MWRDGLGHGRARRAEAARAGRPASARGPGRSGARTCAGRRSRGTPSSSVSRTRRCGWSTGSVRTSSWPLMPRCAMRASSSSSSRSQRNLPRRTAASRRRPVEPAGEVERPADVPPHAVVAADLDAERRCGPARAAPARRGRSRPRAARARQACGSVLRRAQRLEHPVRVRGGVLLGHLLGAADADAARHTVDDAHAR